MLLYTMIKQFKSVRLAPLAHGILILQKIMTMVLYFLEWLIDWVLCSDVEGSLPYSTSNRVMEIYPK